jgi:hypothetical protein
MAINEIENNSEDPKVALERLYESLGGPHIEALSDEDREKMLQEVVMNLGTVLAQDTEPRMLSGGQITIQHTLGDIDTCQRGVLAFMGLSQEEWSVMGLQNHFEAIWRAAQRKEGVEVTAGDLRADVLSFAMNNLLRRGGIVIPPHDRGAGIELHPLAEDIVFSGRLNEWPDAFS